MAKKKVTRRLNSAVPLVSGLVASFSRVVMSPGFIMGCVLGWYTKGNTDFWKKVQKTFAKITPLKTIMEWLVTNTNMAGMMTCVIVCLMLTVPQSRAIPLLMFGVTIIYNGAWRSDNIDMWGLALALCWFGRTNSMRIRASIVGIFLYLALSGNWGAPFTRRIMDWDQPTDDVQPPHYPVVQE